MLTHIVVWKYKDEVSEEMRDEHRAKLANLKNVIAEIVDLRVGADTLHLSRAAYIRRAVERMNRQTQALVRARRLAEASKKVRKESLRVNREFAAFERDPNA